MFPSVLILDSIYKTNKYIFPLLEMVGVTSTKKTYSIGFTVLKCEKEDNFTWALKVCRTLFKDQGEMPKAIVTGRDIALMNLVAKVFPSSNALLCRYHITKNVKSRVKLTVGTKQIESEDGKMVKASVVVEKLMNAWNHIINSSIIELYTDSIMHFRKVCEKYPDLFKYVESTILDQMKENFFCAWTNNVRHLVNTTTNRVESVHATLKNWLGNSKSGSDSTKCGYTIVKTYALSCACVIAKKVKLGDPIRTDEACTHRKILRFDDDGVVNDGKSNISILTEREVIQGRFLKADDNMKLHIKEQLKKISYPETTDMKTPSQPVKTKGAPKKMKPTPNDNLTTQSPFEHVDKVFPDSPTPKSQINVVKGARINKPPPTPPPPKILFIDEMQVFMHKYTKQIINVVGYGFYSETGSGDVPEMHLRNKIIRCGFGDISPESVCQLMSGSY
ncbi:uncharacterized protein LOC127091721 [Lathyrus oleraceus]|uniref:uncharacterized protein LOC127091721 n=1 Tax=Pisum sativum TaxID=3888 RepID=UPI0021D130F0|nr:uncharacterized protein LOC127091721 [Pisum sativum]